ncbi:TetR/AcrR family transcriptional regulator [Dyella sp. C9]|uniref:TetR/AcrR family transcriptional regulator n=1 Tax=Dyella sp. C9 TaxID=2202154 RepID=UPI000DEF8F47|nr:TetR/AcrR family transcriptional regulator [Dyella sp. C9]
MRRRDRSSTEAALIEAAKSEFVNRGYDAATTRGIADAAGCSEVLIQRYFNGKEGLLLAVMREAQAEPGLADFMARPLCASLHDEARELMHKAMDSFVRKSGPIRIALARAMHDEAFSEELARISVRRELQRGLRQRLVRYQQAGMIGEDRDIAGLVELLLSLNFQVGFIYPVLLQATAAKQRRLIEQFAVAFEKAAS